MAKLPPKKSEENSQEWLNTYADMVTLLLTFFVLLFASSNLDEAKMQYIFQAFQSRGKFLNVFVAPQDPGATDDGGVTSAPADGGGEGTMPQSFEELYTYLADYIDENNLSDSVSLINSESHITIRFNNSILFDGDSYILKPEGRQVISGMMPGIKAVNSLIHSMTISGHTAKAVSNINGHSLSNRRAESVLFVVQNYETLGADGIYYTMGCDANNPVADNSTAEGRRQNRRVELTLIKKEASGITDKILKDIWEHDYGLISGEYDPNKQGNDDYKNLPDGSAEKIIGFINDKFSDTTTLSGTYGPSMIDGSEFIIGETESS